VSVHLVYLRTTPAIRQFRAPEGAENNWHEALNQVSWAAATRQVGRSAERDGGRRCNVYLETASVARTVKQGKGNLSESIRIGLRRV
jgi:hypothetical protein